jgi:hypothetical protein
MGCSVEVNMVELVPLDGSLDSYFFCNDGVLGDEDGWEDMEEYVGLNEGEAVSSERKETVDLEGKGILKGEPPQQDDTRAKQHHKGSKRERTLFSIVNQIWPSVDQKIFDKIMNEDISDKEVEPYLSLVADMFPYADVRARWDPCIDWRMSRICDDITMRQSPYGEKFRRSFRRRWGETRRKGLRRFTNWREQHKTIDVNTAYKKKAQKVQPVDANDGTGDGPGGRRDWYKRSRARDTPQEHTGKYKEHLLLRIASFPRGSRLTPERLASLDCGKWLWPEEERAMFEEIIMNREGAIAFEWNEVSKIHEDVSPPILIKTIAHDAWQEKNFPCPKALFPTVLTYDVRLMDQDKSRKTKLLYRWLGPFRVKKANKLKGSYVLEEMDGTQLKRTYAGNRLKKFLTRDGKWDSEESDASAGQIDAEDEPGSDAESGFRRIGRDNDGGQ